MRAWVNDIANDRIDLREIPEPQPGPGELLIEVKAAGVNRADLAMRGGRYRPGFGSLEVAGIEGAGVVIGTGPGCERFGVGDRVMGMCTGTYAERCLLDDGIAIAVPEAVSFLEAAVLPVGCCTQHDAIVSKARLHKGEHLLVTAATSGVGELALKIGRIMGAGSVIGTTRTASRAERVGAADHMVLTGDGFVDQVRSLTGGAGADVIVDQVGGNLVQDLIDAASIGARIVSVGRLGGAISEINTDELARKQISLIGVTFRTRDRAGYASVAQAAEADLAAPIASGALRALVEQTFEFDQAEGAQDALAQGNFVGKIALHIAD
jgi:NADPH2:quinone reductase